MKNIRYIVKIAWHVQQERLPFQIYTDKNEDGSLGDAAFCMQYAGKPIPPREPSFLAFI